MYVSDPTRLPGNGRRSLRDLDVVGKGLADRGISVRVDGPDGPILALGNVQRSAVQRAITGSAYVRVGSPSALAPLLRRWKDRAATMIAPPPTTMLPLAPTLNRFVQRRVTTTHYLPGSGRPRLIFAVGSTTWDGRRPREFDLTADRVTIGSDAACDLVLDGLAPLHAEIRHERGDEYILYAIEEVGGGSAPEPGRPPEKRRILRTGARMEMGPWRLAFFREEFADHGRPFGGRQGGEYAVQRRQSPRRTTPGTAGTDDRSIYPQG
ncbi:MAG: hypothetical protein ABS61_04680 [Microbacterium sp. SCN 70-18]|nr:hypothetical protein [Microbacterium chocolatum]ODT11268.1 MAG: hypothetical protein ABS61_04680 [Microbacterium sp. SCN 70-18]